MKEAHRAATEIEGEGSLFSRQEAFTAALRLALAAADRTQGRIAEKAGIAASTMSCYVTGRRVPGLENLESIYKALEADVVAQGGELPHSLPYLLDLRLDAALEKRFPETLAKAPHEAEPAIPDASESSPAEQTVAPVPSSEGDRRNSVTSHAADIAAYGRHLAAGRVRDAHFHAWAMGSRLPSNEFPLAVASYRRSGAEEAVETMLNAAADRDVQASINIAAALLDEGHLADARALLNVLRDDA
ncbi:helix-turn-helix domain-containing protein [Streptomyces beigongshangae]|uniref:helix-turn-helix domain-containing protein n=1 Tax=Streptomyces beigongshangae TaxID=2841597 RepID=UPI001C859A48|nr:helix-turn-helix transcriptional regulator [Streptomyces sp. REN17]